MDQSRARRAPQLMTALATLLATLLATFLVGWSSSAPAQADSGGGVAGVARADQSSLAVGYSFACVVVTDGSVRCWGDNSAGQLGQGNTVGIGDDVGESTVKVPLPRPASAVAAGTQTACAVLVDGQLWCWGGNTYGQLLRGNTDNAGDDGGEGPVHIDLGPTHRVTAVALGGDHVCAVLELGQVWCWGGGGAGQLDTGSITIRGDQVGDVPATVSLPRPAVTIAAAESSTCALLDTGDLYCWGDGNHGQLMQGNEDNIGDGPNEPPALLHISPRHGSAIAGGRSFYCSIYDDGQLRCWGASAHGELGMGRTEDFGDDSSPSELDVGTNDVVPPGRRAVAVAANNTDACAILDDGGLRCWGSNEEGQLGQGQATGNIGDAPGEHSVTVDLGGSVRAVDLGWHLICAVTDNGNVRCWGAGGAGQLGQGSKQNYGLGTGELPRVLPPINLGGLTVGRDTDGDGVRDAVDGCPTVAGTSNGCAPSTTAPPGATLKGTKVVIDTVLAKTKASAKCPKKAKVVVKTKTTKGKLTVTKQLRSKTAIGGCRVKGKVKLPAKPAKKAKVKVTITGKKLRTEHLVAVRP